MLDKGEVLHPHTHHQPQTHLNLVDIHHQAKPHPHGPVRGIDVSWMNGDINWGKVSRSHVDFAYIKATEGAHNRDFRFHENWRESIHEGVRHGAYHFFQPKKSVHQQVHNYLHTVGHIRKHDLPPMLDLEKPVLYRGLTSKQSADRALHWLRDVEKATGRRPIIYTNPGFAEHVLHNDPRFAKYPLWISHYGVSKPNIPAPYHHYTFWQKTKTGHVKGVHGYVDLDYYRGNRTLFNAFN